MSCLLKTLETFNLLQNCTSLEETCVFVWLMEFRQNNEAVISIRVERFHCQSLCWTLAKKWLWQITYQRQKNNWKIFWKMCGFLGMYEFEEYSELSIKHAANLILFEKIFPPTFPIRTYTSFIYFRGKTRLLEHTCFFELTFWYRLQHKLCQ